MSFHLKIQILFSFFSIAFNSYSQIKTFSVLPSTSKNSNELISNCKQLNSDALKEINYLRAGVYNGVRKLYLKRTDLLIKKIVSGNYISDDELQNLVNSVKQNLEIPNGLKSRKRQILIEKSPVINASCLGEGSFSLNIGLLAKIENEDQLAFILAHELAHYELDHVKNRILKSIKNNYSEQVKLASLKIGSESDMIEGLTSLKELMYSIGSYSRSDELEADSLGLIYILNAKYNYEEAISSIDLLENSNEPKHPLGNELFDLFDYKEYPFDIEWLRPRLAAFSKKTRNAFAFPNDSLQSHPTYELRRFSMKRQMLNFKKSSTIIRNIDSEIIKSELESIEASRYYKQIDLSIYLAMQFYNRHPNQQYARNMIAKNLLVLQNAKLKGVFDFFVSPYTGYYSEELRYLNTFLFNLSRKETLEITYHFLKNQNNSVNEEYYYLLWKTCDLSYRKQEKKEVQKLYKQLFPNGKPLSSYGR